MCGFLQSARCRLTERRRWAGCDAPIACLVYRSKWVDWNRLLYRRVDGKASRFVGTDPGIGNVADFFCWPRSFYLLGRMCMTHRHTRGNRSGSTTAVGSDFSSVHAGDGPIDRRNVAVQCSLAERLLSDSRQPGLVMGACPPVVRISKKTSRQPLPYSPRGYTIEL
jgi:hypothetical protein